MNAASETYIDGGGCGNYVNIGGVIHRRFRRRRRVLRPVLASPCDYCERLAVAKTGFSIAMQVSKAMCARYYSNANVCFYESIMIPQT